MSLGTPAYMSPEQAVGERTLDARTDIYALGCVLYEMLVGEPPFTGPTAQAIVARVMTEEPRSITAQRRTVPAYIEAAVEVALAKLPADRFVTAGEFAAALGGEATAVSRSALGTGLRRPERRASTVTVALVAGLVVAASLAVWGWLRPRPTPPVTRSYVRFPDAEAPVFTPSSLALLPDASALIYVGKGSGGTQLWVKKRSELHATPLGGTEGATNVFVSPDGAWIGFLADSKLKKIPASGGEATTLVNAPCNSIACIGGAESGTWLDDGRIAFVSNGRLVLIPSTGGAVDSLERSPAVGGLGSILPVALPGSHGLLFTTCTLYCNKSNVMVFDLRSREARMLVEDASSPRYLPTGHLLYVDARGNGVAVPFDLSTLTIRGTPTPVLDRAAGNFAISSTGTLVYVEGDRAGRAELSLVSRDGRTVQSVDSTWRGNFATLALSPDGRRIAVSVVAEGQEHLWIKTLGGGTPTRLTFGKQQNTTPTWTADGASVLFTRFEGMRSSTFLSKRVDGTSRERTLKTGDNWVIESETSRDGQWLVMREYRPVGKREIYARRMTGDTAERAVVATGTEDISPSLSPNGKFLAYASDESGNREVWVVPFPDPQGAKWQVSTNGGFEPLWSRDGREIFYVTPSRDLMAAEVSTSGAFSVGARRVLFNVGAYRRHFTHRAYDVLPDNQRFVMIRDVGPLAGELVMVDNWTSELVARLRK